MAATAPASAPSTASLLFKMFRWIFLAVLIVVVLLMLKKPAPPSSIAAARTPKELTAAATSFDDKIAGLEDAHARGEAGSQVKLSDDELNGALQRSTGALPEAAPSGQSDATAPAATKPQLPANLQEESGPVAVKSSQVAMIDDQIVLQFVVDRYGKDIYVTLSTRIGVEDHHLNLHPTGMKIGELSVPIAMAEETVQKKIHEPENWEKMKLPDFVKDVRVEHGELVVAE